MRTLKQTLSRTMILIGMLLATSTFVVAQTITVTGTVVDNNGEPIIGASVVQSGTANGVITDIDGKFTLTNVPANAGIRVSYVGYITQNMALNGRTTLKVVLWEDTQQLEEVVVVGYGTQRKSDVTGALVRVDAKEIVSRPVSNALEAMQGKAAGVDITSNERPGELGNIYIRGVRSIGASSAPLYVIDGIPSMTAGIETLNPGDIESIDILKDASATAIYGSQGANGVILVTTKRGKAGRLTLNYSGTVTAETLEDYTQWMNSAEYIEWRRWSYYYQDPTKYPRADQPNMDNDRKIFLGDNDATAWNNIMRGWAGGTWDGSKVETTDWGALVTHTGITTEHTLSASGGTDKMSAYGSFGFLSNDGTMMGQKYTRYTAKASVDINPLKWFKMGASINTTYSIQQYGQSGTGGLTNGPTSIYAAAVKNFPYALPYDDKGNRIDYPGGDDMVKTAIDEWKYTNDERMSFRALGSLYANIDFGAMSSLLKGLSYRVNFGPDFRFYRNGIYIDTHSVNRPNSPSYASKSHRQTVAWTFDNLLYYNRTFGKHNLGVTLLHSATAYDDESTYLQAVGIPFPSQKWNALGTLPGLNDWDTGITKKQLLSYMARVNYSLSEKYLITVSGRWDGASQLSEGHRWDFFPSAALGWRIDQESFMKDISWITQLKLRLGVGTTGNSAIQPYATRGPIVPLYYPFGSSLTAGYVAYEPLISGGNVRMANKDVGWEKTTQYNLGVDFAFIGGRIGGTLDLYTTKTTDLLLPKGISPVNGYTSTIANVGETSNIGFDLTLNTINVKTRDFQWTTNLNIAWQKDQIDLLANGKEDDISNGWFIGESVGGVIYGYESAGLWKEEDAEEMAKFNANGHKFQAGLSRPVDQDGDYRIDPNYDRVIIGHRRPQWTVGMTNTWAYKGIELSVFFSGRLGYTWNTGGEWQGGRYVQRLINYYNENNKANAEYQKPIYDVAGGDPYSGILGYRDGSFLKIRNISLGYFLPKRITKQLGVSSLKLYAQAKNPGMLYAKIDWFDPDLGGSTWNRGYTFGVNVEF